MEYEIVKIEGNLIFTDPISKQAIKKAINSNEKNIEIDMSRVESIDSMGINLIVRLALAIKERKGHLKIVGVNKVIFDVMEICSLNRIASIISYEKSSA